MSKHDSEKYEPTLIYTSLIKEVAAVRKYGAEKYGSTEDWRTTPPIRHFNAIMRHLNAFLDGEYDDKESGLSHLAHAATTLMMEIERLACARAARQMFGEFEENVVEKKCERCGASDEYPMHHIMPCTNGCRNLIET